MNFSDAIVCSFVLRLLCAYFLFLSIISRKTRVFFVFFGERRIFYGFSCMLKYKLFKDYELFLSSLACPTLIHYNSR